MRHNLTIFVAIVALFTFGDAATAETEIKVSGQVRLRSETDKKAFDTDAHAKQFTDLRTRLQVEAIIDTNTHAVVQLQDSRRLGGSDQFGSPQSGQLTNGANVDVHQAYVQIDHLFWERLSTRGGRFEVNLGNERVFGAVGWSNIGRTWEGGVSWINFDNWKLSAYGLKALELNSSVENRDFDLYGLTGTFPTAGLELFAFLEHDARIFAVDTNNLDRFSFGGHFKDRFEQVDLELNGVYQAGEMGRMDIAAFLVTAEVGYNFEGERNVRVAAGIDYASGDDGTDPTETKAYNNLYYTGHKFRGYMDYFVSSNSEGLIDAMLRGKLDIAPKWVVKGDFHFFKTAEDYTISSPGGPISTSDVGIEIDLSVKTTRVSGVAIQAGLSFFLPKDDFATYSGFSTNDAGVWGYSMVTANF